MPYSKTMRLTSQIFFLIALGIGCSNSPKTKYEYPEEVLAIDTSSKNPTVTEALQTPLSKPENDETSEVDSTDCIWFEGENSACEKGLVCPGNNMYSSVVLSNHINNNLAIDTEKIPSTYCRHFDTLSLEKEIYLLELCWGGSYTEAWTFSLNNEGLFVGRKHGFIGTKLDSKTNGVNNFRLVEHSAHSYAIMGYDGLGFDTLEVIWCDWLDEEKTGRKLNCWDF